MKKTVLVILLSFILVLLCACNNNNTTPAPADLTNDTEPTETGSEEGIKINPLTEKITLVYGTSPLASNAEMAGAAICAVVSEHSPLLDVNEQVTAGGAENLRLLRNSEVDFSSVSDGINGWFGRGAYDGEGGAENIRSVMTLYGSTYVLVTLASNDEINTIYDLEGKRVTFGPAGSSCYTACTWLFDAHNMTDKVKIETLSYTDANDALIDGTIDALIGFFGGGIPSDALLQLDNSTKLKVVEQDEAAISAAADDNYMLGNLTVDSISCITEPMPCMRNLGMVIYARKDTPNDAVYEFVKQVYSNLEKITTYHQICSAISLDDAMSGFPKPIPVHPGAAAYFIEQGVWDDSYEYRN